MRLTPAMLESAYELLRTTPPFRGWRLPPPDEIEFHVTRHKDRCGDHVFDGETHTIRISGNMHSQIGSLLLTMAHEMCHLRQSALDHPERSEHGRQFKALAKTVCRHHRWDAANF